LFFYESVINLIGFAVLYTAAWFWTKKPNGVFTFAYFIWYGTTRTFMEPLRDPSYILGNASGQMSSQTTAILFIVMGFIGIAVLLVLNWRKEGAFFGSKEGDPCGITKYLSPDKNEEPYFSKINILGKNYPPKPEAEKSGFFRFGKKPKAPSEEGEQGEEDGQSAPENPVTEPEEDKKEGEK
ncbi:MAG: prolipoprotein diacylglyceryl transferase, partial [Clostridiales bacterium]|nr:prolipoprotein diacylglyceryl transferase [Clostridiales bacterium]